MFEKFTLQSFIADTASAKPVPGGGSVAALTAANGAALMAMLCNLTANKKGYEAHAQKMEALAKKYAAAAQDFLSDIDRDCAAFEAYMAALKLPKDTPSAAEERAEKLALAVDGATAAPMSVAEKAEALLDDAEYILTNGNKTATSDGIIAVRLLAEATRAALCNVAINLPYIKDADKRAAAEQKSARLEQSARDKAENILKGIKL